MTLSIVHTTQSYSRIRQDRPSRLEAPSRLASLFRPGLITIFSGRISTFSGRVTSKNNINDRCPSTSIFPITTGLHDTSRFVLILSYLCSCSFSATIMGFFSISPSSRRRRQISLDASDLTTANGSQHNNGEAKKKTSKGNKNHGP